MPVDPSNARELAQIASEVGADVLTGDLRYPSETGGWQLYGPAVRGIIGMGLFVALAWISPSSFVVRHLP